MAQNGQARGVRRKEAERGFGFGLRKFRAHRQMGHGALIQSRADLFLELESCSYGGKVRLAQSGIPTRAQLGDEISDRIFTTVAYLPRVSATARVPVFLPIRRAMGESARRRHDTGGPDGTARAFK
jgi:hypothetical protein